MTLQASFPLSASQINIELGRNATDPFDIQGVSERDLAGMPSGAISFSDFLGKSNQQLTIVDTQGPSGTTSNHNFTCSFGPVIPSRQIMVFVFAHGKAQFSAPGAQLLLDNFTVGGVAVPGPVGFFFRSGASGVTDFTGVATGMANPSGTSGTIHFDTAISVNCTVVTVVARSFVNNDRSDFCGTDNTGASALTCQVDNPAGGAVTVCGIKRNNNVLTTTGVTTRQSFQPVGGYQAVIGFDVKQGVQVNKTVGITSAGSTDLAVAGDTWI